MDLRGGPTTPRSLLAVADELEALPRELNVGSYSLQERDLLKVYAGDLMARIADGRPDLLAETAGALQKLFVMATIADREKAARTVGGVAVELREGVAEDPHAHALFFGDLDAWIWRQAEQDVTDGRHDDKNDR